MIAFNVPGPPKPWQRAGRGAHGSFTQPETVAYQRAVRDAYALAVMRLGFIPLTTGRFRVGVEVTYQDAKRRDLDNQIKSICDALNEVAWDDDSQIDDMQITRHDPSRTHPQTWIVIERLRDEPAKTKAPRARKVARWATSKS